MDKSIMIWAIANYSPRFKPWAMKLKYGNQNHFNGL
jgi:hypothetical protein